MTCKQTPAWSKKYVHIFSEQNNKVAGKISTSNEARFKELMQSNESSVIEAFSKFLKEASAIRRNHQGR